METQMACRAAPNVIVGHAYQLQRHTNTILNNHMLIVVAGLQWILNSFR